jgi:hypothetical protein
VGAILKSSEEQRAVYRKAFAEYNARFDAFTRGAFYGIDELTHVHIYPDGGKGVILCFNLSDQEVEREFDFDLDSWDMPDGAVTASGAQVSGRKARVTIPPKGVTIVDFVVS